ncbi:MAG TPA: PDZ domain-containing protein [Candidatus Acidoferrales bacterium]|nr:PDZ domain-containing protein [Candidatus Acidoferrales bacterium]
MKSMFVKLPLLVLAVFAAIHVSPVFAGARNATTGPKLLLLQTPTLSKTQIAFVYGGDIWTVPREGGDAHRLVTGTDLETGPIFSPDGSMVAFSGNYDGNVDVYVVPSTGGEPRRLTYHPGPDIALGWTPDGKSILFQSSRTSDNDPHHLFTVPVTGGLAAQLPLGMAEDGSYSPDGTHMAYVPVFQWEPDWKGYRGGQTTPVWIANLADSSVVKVPRENSNDGDPMWVGKTVYFLSDRDGARTLFAYDTGSQKVTRAIDNHGFDITSASAGPGAIVYSQFGVLHLYDLKSHSDREVHVTVSADMPQLLPHWVKVADQIQDADISPSGQRAVFEAHGDIFTVPADKGDIRDITNTAGAAEREPAWSPDGRWISYFSDASGEYELHIRDQKGLEPPKVINLGKPAFYYSPVWSPDSKKIAYADKFLNFWYVDIDHPTPVKVDTSQYEGFGNELSESWSPDSQWITYTKRLSNYMQAVFVYSLATKQVTQITDGMSDCSNPKFDKSGKYLYFLASTNTGLTAAGLDMTSDEHPVTSSIYVAVLRKDLPSPIPPESDDEKASAGSSGQAAAAKAGESQKSGEKASDKSKEPPKVEIDFEGILQRILALPIPAGGYQDLYAGKEGEIYFSEGPVVSVSFGPPQLSIKKFDLKSRKVENIASGIQGFTVSSDGEKILYTQARHWFIADASHPVQAGKGMLKTDDMEVRVVPREEWNQMYREVWRIERDFFYDPHYHGYDIAAAEKEFAAYLPGLASREDLNFLFREMLSYMSVGHMFIRGGAEPDTPKVNVGLLGADYTVENGRYRFAKIYSGENWNPQLKAPLTEPGVNVKEGEYLLAVDGRELTSSENVYQAFQETAGKQTVIRVGPNPNTTGSREVTVVPIPSERALRHLDWIESNRRLVDKLSGGKLAYVYLPDTGGGGYTSFNRYFFAQVGKEGAILDERFNHGGQIADYIIDYLNRKPEALIFPRDGRRMMDPTMAIYGPKVMLINQFAGSGGDAMPWLFRKEGVGTLVGMRTWGGLVGIGGYPVLMDGGTVTAPRTAIGGLNGHWEVENHGIPPDVEVWQDPKLVREGHDPQLEKAVAVAMEQLKEHPLPQYPKPPYPDHHPHLPALPNQ